MAAPQTALGGNDHPALRASLRRLRDEVIDLYLDWREEASAAAEAYVLWTDAQADDKAARFTAFRAAIEREEAAARSYGDAVACGERLLGSS